MATTILAGTSTALALLAGTTITLTGAGTAQFVPTGGAGGARQLRQLGAAPTVIGPVARDETLNITADSSGNGVAYTTRSTGDVAAMLPAAAVAAGATAAAGVDEAANIFDKGGQRRILAPPKANTTFSKYGATAYNLCFNDITIGVTALAHALANERPAFQPYTRKCTLSASVSQIRYTSISFTADQTENALAIRLYIDQMVTEFSAANPFVTLELSNTPSLGANSSRWTFDATYLKQGENLLLVRRDDTVSATAGAGNLPVGCSHAADVGTGFDWTGVGQYLALSFNNMNGFTVHVDELRRPAKVIPYLTMGFDANGASNTDDIFVKKVAPMFAAIGLRSYFTLTNVYELQFAGTTTQAWMRMATLQDSFHWNGVVHTWSHGATDVGRVTINSTSLSRTSNVVTATWSGGHSLSQRKMLKASIQGTTPSDMAGVFDVSITGANTLTYSAPGADGAASVQGKLYTFLSEVFNSNSTENQRLLRKEITHMQLAARTSGLNIGRRLIFWPNNSVPDIDLTTLVCGENGIQFGRGYRGGYTPVDELGVVNPLHMGSIVLDSGTATFKRVSEICAKILGAVARGQDLHIYGHFVQDANDPANPVTVVDRDYPPGQGGNPNPPAGVSLSGFGGWFYLDGLQQICDFIKPLVDSGQLRLGAPSEYAAARGVLQ